MSQELEKEISKLNDKTIETVQSIKTNIEELIEEKINSLSEKSSQYIETTEKLKVDAKKRFESYYNRKKIIDFLIYINLALTPFLFAIVVYILFFKK